jgi:hypothetical protein
MAKIESVKKKQDIKKFCIGILENSLGVKFPLKISPPGNFPLHEKFSPCKIHPTENSSSPPHSKNDVCILPNNK